MQAFGEGLPTRVFSLTERPGQNFDDGSFIITERELDVAVQGKGWLSVQDAEGNEAYTRAGNLQLSPTGQSANCLRLECDRRRWPYYSCLCPLAKMEIGQETAPSGIRPQGAPANVMQEVARHKSWLSQSFEDIEKGTDGLFRRKDGEVAEVDATVKVLSGAVEGSNVNAVGEMTQMISLQRQFEVQVKMMKTAEEMDRQHNQVMTNNLRLEPQEVSMHPALMDQ